MFKLFNNETIDEELNPSKETLENLSNNKGEE